MFRFDDGNLSSENDDGDESIVLVDNEERFTVFLLKNAKPSSIVWVTDDEVIQQAAEKGNVSILSVGEFAVGKMMLKSQSCIILSPQDLVSSFSGRKSLMKVLDALSENSVIGGERLLERELGTSAEPEFNLPKFPSLQVRLLGQNGGGQSRFQLNSRKPIDVESDLFKGKLLAIIKPPNAEDDPYWNERIFSKKKRRMIIQIQGKFKYQPKGVVYAGAEVSEQMKLGLLAKGLCGVLLRLVESFNSHVHYSFGDRDGKEKPHIVVPAYTFFERVVVTQPGKEPPAIDELFEESKESIATRKKGADGSAFWNTTDTFSFSFYSMYIDLPTWQLTGLPLQGDISLKTFWKDSLLKIGMYEKLGDHSEHYQNSNNYAFAIQVSIGETCV